MTDHRNERGWQNQNDYGGDLSILMCRYAASVKDGSQYFVLLIITDGVISDMAQTKESIVNVSIFPVALNTTNSMLWLMHLTIGKSALRRWFDMLHHKNYKPIYRISLFIAL